MLNKINDTILFEAVSQVFEEAVFALLEKSEDEISWDPDTMIASMNFKGPLSGVLYLCVPEEYSIEIAANLLGLEPDNEELEEKKSGAIKELLNMVVGIFINKVYGESQAYHLGIPSMIELSQSEFSKILSNSQAKVLCLDDFDNTFSLMAVVK
ncbi:MAG: chemotaxis protein CheX [Deltaproteobacteria bacterium]|nr:chemotaxis protein CheX [Deltaproteobacteria bacterium]